MKGDVSLLDCLPTQCDLGDLSRLLVENCAVISDFAGVDVYPVLSNYYFDTLHPGSAPAGGQKGVLIMFRESVKVEDCPGLPSGKVVDPIEVITSLCLALDELSAGRGWFDSLIPWRKSLVRLTGQEYMTLVNYRSFICPGFDWRGKEHLRPSQIKGIIEMVRTGRDVVADLPRRSRSKTDEGKRPSYVV